MLKQAIASEERITATVFWWALVVLALVWGIILFLFPISLGKCEDLACIFALPLQTFLAFLLPILSASVFLLSSVCIFGFAKMLRKERKSGSLIGLVCSSVSLFGVCVLSVFLFVRFI